MASLKCKQKLRGFPEDKNSSRRKVLIRELHKKLLSDPRKGKVDPRIAIRRSLIRTMNVAHFVNLKSSVCIIRIRIIRGFFHNYSLFENKNLL